MTDQETPLRETLRYRPPGHRTDPVDPIDPAVNGPAQAATITDNGSTSRNGERTRRPSSTRNTTSTRNATSTRNTTSARDIISAWSPRILRDLPIMRNPSTIRVLAIVIGVVVLATSLIVFASALLFGDRGDQGAAPNDNQTRAVAVADPADTTEALATAPTAAPPDAAVGQAVVAPPLQPGELLVDFATAWQSGDWSGMGTLASADVVTIAQQWYSDGGSIDITTAEVGAALDRCYPIGDGQVSCPMVYTPTGGSPMVFNAVYSMQGNGTIMTDLIFGGAAG